MGNASAGSSLPAAPTSHLLQRRKQAGQSKGRGKAAKAQLHAIYLCHPGFFMPVFAHDFCAHANQTQVKLLRRHDFDTTLNAQHYVCLCLRTYEATQECAFNLFPCLCKTAVEPLPPMLTLGPCNRRSRSSSGTCTKSRASKATPWCGLKLPVVTKCLAKMGIQKLSWGKGLQIATSASRRHRRVHHRSPGTRAGRKLATK